MTWPKNNADFWRQKIQRNMERDKEVGDRLEVLGWKLLRFWEHEIKSNTDSVAKQIDAAISLCL